MSRQSWFNSRTQTFQLGAIAALAVVLVSLFQWLLFDRDAETRNLDHYGSLIANQLTRLSKDAMVREDVIALNVLAEQVASDPAIGSVTVYALDGRILAGYGPAVDQDGARSHAHEFNRPIQLADATAGFVRVTVNPEALNPVSETFLGSPFSRTAASWLLTALALWGVVGWLTRSPRRSVEQLRAEHSEEDVILLIVRLFNANEMTGGRRDALMHASEAHIGAVAKLYNSKFVRIAPDATAVVFESPEADDRAFQAACAALAISRLCNQPGGARYRYSLQHVSVPPTDPSDLTETSDARAHPLLDPLMHPTLEDALLHAALADDNTVVLSATYAQRMPRPERLELTREHSPALQGLQTSEARDYYLVSGAGDATETMLDRQVVTLRKAL